VCNSGTYIVRVLLSKSINSFKENKCITACDTTDHTLRGYSIHDSLRTYVEHTTHMRTCKYAQCALHVVHPYTQHGLCMFYNTYRTKYWCVYAADAILV
jgi:hypothetical protein